MKSDTNFRKHTYLGNALFYATLASIGSFAHAADITITTEVTSQQIPDEGGGLLIEGTGVLNKSDGGAAIRVSNDSTSIENQGTITAIYGINLNRGSLSSGINNSGLIDVDQTAIDLSSSTSITGGITNSGTINASSAIATYTSTSITGGITNSGTINADDTAFSLTSTSITGGITNTGTINGGFDDVSGDAIYFYYTTLDDGLTNSGTIDAKTDAMAVDASSVINGGITNTSTGTISGEANAIVIADDSIINGGIDNDGTISGDIGIAIIESGTLNNGLTNSGTITGVTDGIQLTSAAAINGGISNSGTISSINNAGAISGATAISLIISGVITNGLTNSGTISGTTRGIQLAGSSAINGGITNSGTISGGSYGISLSSGPTITGGITNTGTITGGIGIVLTSGASFTGGITNSGTIAGTGGTAINFYGSDNNELTNSGTITGAIEFGGGDNNHLTLNVGSTVSGVIAFGAGSGNEVTIGEGHSSAAYSFTGNIDTINTSEDTVAVSNEEAIAVVRTSGFEAVSDTPLYSSVSISNVVSNRLTVARLNDNAYSEIQLANSNLVTNDADNGWIWRSKQHRQFWAEAFGAYKERSAYQSAEAIDNRTGGIVFGVDMPLDDTKRIGGFIGGLSSTTHVGNTITNYKADSYGGFGGGYISLNQYPYSLDLSITVGSNENDGKRYVTSGSDIDTVRASYRDVFITPTVSIGRAFNPPVITSPVVGTLTVRYTGQWVDSYTETGYSEANLEVDDRFLHTASGRIQLETANKAQPVGSGMLRVNSRIGVEANTSIDDEEVKITVLGQKVSFNSNGRGHNADGFLGLNVSYDLDNHINLYTDIEVNGSITDTLIDNMGGFGRAGVRIKF